MAKKILIVEDEPDVARLLRYNLEREGFRISAVADGSLTLAEMRRDPADLVILDLMLPGMDGLEICRQLRRHEKYSTIPILILTARSDEADRVVGLELGADDYVTKPFSMRELIARVRALLRRQEPVPQKNSLLHGEIHIDPSAPPSASPAVMSN
jgi:two-component system alkaline phosphatase synthesis response regulator PhoP